MREGVRERGSAKRAELTLTSCELEGDKDRVRDSLWTHPQSLATPPGRKKKRLTPSVELVSFSNLSSAISMASRLQLNGPWRAVPLMVQTLKQTHKHKESFKNHNRPLKFSNTRIANIQTHTHTYLTLD